MIVGIAEDFCSAAGRTENLYSFTTIEGSILD